MKSFPGTSASFDFWFWFCLSHHGKWKLSNIGVKVCESFLRKAWSLYLFFLLSFLLIKMETTNCLSSLYQIFLEGEHINPQQFLAKLNKLSRNQNNDSCNAENQQTKQTRNINNSSNNNKIKKKLMTKTTFPRQFIDFSRFSLYTRMNIFYCRLLLPLLLLQVLFVRPLLGAQF